MAPGSWPASICPSLWAVLVCRLKGYPLGLLRSVLLVLTVVLLQSAVNVLNDYADFVKGTDSREDNLEESDAVLLYTDIPPRSALYLGLVLILLGMTSGILGALPNLCMPLFIGGIGAAVVMLYSTGPLPVYRLPLGEAVSGFVMGGLIPLGVFSCTDGKLHTELLPACLPFIIGIAMIMLCNNSCDIEKDRKVGRHTLPTFIGRNISLVMLKLLVPLWIAAIIWSCFRITERSGTVVVTCICLLLFAGRFFAGLLFKLKLRPEERIRQMKTISAANLTAGLSMIPGLLASILFP